MFVFLEGLSVFNESLHHLKPCLYMSQRTVDTAASTLADLRCYIGKTPIMFMHCLPYSKIKG